MQLERKRNEKDDRDTKQKTFLFLSEWQTLGKNIEIIGHLNIKKQKSCGITRFIDQARNNCSFFVLFEFTKLFWFYLWARFLLCLLQCLKPHCLDFFKFFSSLLFIHNPISFPVSASLSRLKFICIDRHIEVWLVILARVLHDVLLLAIWTQLLG